MKTYSLYFFLIFGLICCFNSATAEPALQPSEQKQASIVLGATLDSNPVKKSFKEGVELYLNKVNASGGINGRKLEFITLDDNDNPATAGQNIRFLIDEKQAIAFTGGSARIGIPILTPIANAKKVLFIDYFHQEDKTPAGRYVINLVAPTDKYCADLINGVLSTGIKPEEIAFFVQNDSFGDFYYESCKKALKAAGYPHPDTLPMGRFAPSSTNFEGGLASILHEAMLKDFHIKFILVITLSNTDLTGFFRLAHKEIPNAFFFTNPYFTTDLSNEGINVYAADTVPLINTHLPLMKEILEDLKKTGSSDEKSLSYKITTKYILGYLLSKLYVEAVKRAATKNNLTREGLIDAFESLHNFDIGIGIPINLDKNNHVVLNSFWLIGFKNGEQVNISWSDIDIQNGGVLHK